MTKNLGKQFEKDFQASASKVMSYDRLNDPASSFNIECNGCPKKKTRFAPRHICDAIGYKFPNQYYFELKSVKGKSIPFKNIVKNEKDKRLNKLSAKNEFYGAFSFVIINFRTEANKTYALHAKNVLKYIKTDSRKSIPIEFCKSSGFEIESIKKIVHYKYNINKFLIDIKRYPTGGQPC